MFRPKRYESARIIPVGNLWCKDRPCEETFVETFDASIVPAGTILAPKVSHRDDPCTFLNHLSHQLFGPNPPPELPPPEMPPPPQEKVRNLGECGEGSGVHWWRRVEKVVVGWRREGGVMVVDDGDSEKSMVVVGGGGC
ncbi:hypothetical protein Tco_1035002 [Tanacetum coccineum]